MTTSVHSLWLDRAIEPNRDILPADGRFDDLVIGAGLTGLTAALLLARAGRRVGVVEARHVGGGTTGGTTGKVSLLQGTKLSTILRRRSASTAEVYVDANREGMEWLLRFCSDHQVPFQRRDAVTYAASSEEMDRVRGEHEAARSLGLPVEWRTDLDVPFPHVAATVLADQAQVDPMAVLEALVQELRLHGGTVHEGDRVVNVGAGPSVTLASGPELSAEHVVLATGTPIVDRGLHFARLEAKRSYLLAFTGAKAPEAMYLSAGSSARSVRDAPGEEETRLLVGGAGHVVGRTDSTLRHVEELRDWVDSYFPGAKETHVWSAQDYAPYGGVPMVGRVPWSQDAVYVATGFDKWGLANAVASAHAITADILGSHAPVASGRTLRPLPVLQLARINAGVVAALARGYARSQRAGVIPTADSKVEGRDCRLVGVCTHLGGPLSWNDAEESWDCALHGSRFAADGTVLEGPATRPLRRR